EDIVSHSSFFNSLPFEDIREDQRHNDRGVGFNNEFRRLHTQFPPRNFFVRDGPGIRSVTGGRIADLTKVSPEGDLRFSKVLTQHGNDTNGEIAGNPASDLKKSER